jgi:hypothetical protein
MQQHKESEISYFSYENAASKWTERISQMFVIINLIMDFCQMALFCIHPQKKY